MNKRATWCSVIVRPTGEQREPVADDVRVAAEALLACPQPGARRVGMALQAWMRRGGDLQTALGLRPARGKASAPRKAARQARDAALRQLAATIDATTTERARLIARWARSGAPAVRAIHCELAPVPGSPAQLKRILRESE